MEEYSLLTSEEDLQVVSNTGCTNSHSDVNQSCEELSLISEDDEYSLLSSDVEELLSSEPDHPVEEVSRSTSTRPSEVKSASEQLDSGRDDEQSPRYCESGKRKRVPFSLAAEVPFAKVGFNSDSRSSSSNTECPRQQDATNIKKFKKKGPSRVAATDDIILGKVPCCAKGCLKKLPGEQVRSARAMFTSKRSVEQRQWILDYLNTHMEEDHVSFVIGGDSLLCGSAWRSCLGLTRSRYFEVLRLKRSQMVFLEHGNKGMGHNTEVHVQESKAFLSNYVKTLGDMMPDNNEVHLPTCLKKGDVYNEMCETLKSRNVKPCSFSHFRRIWPKNVKIRKENRFTKCTKCVKFKDDLQKCADKKEREKTREQRDKHLKKQKSEREKYYKHANKARNDSNKYMSIILDGMDQNKSNIPHFPALPKALASLHQLRTHIVGVIVHGKGTETYVAEGQRWPQDTNLTLTVLLKALLKHKTTQEVLYLQFDNCCRENKNKWVLCFCFLLVKIKVFKKIKVGFLMVGHTHEDIDQYFSCIARLLNKFKVLTMSQLLDKVKQVNRKDPVNAELLECIFNIREWINDFIPDLHGHLKSYQFKFEAANDGVQFLYKKRSTSEEWILVDQDKFPILEELPSGSPEIVKSSFDEMKVPLFSRHLRTTYFKWMPEECKKEWEEWMQKIQQEIDGQNNREPEWQFEKLRQTARPELWERGSETEREGEKDSDSDHPEVYAGPYRNARVRRTRLDQQQMEGNIPVDEADHSEATDSLKPVDLRELTVGLHVAIYKKEWSNRPLIGQVEHIEPASVNIRWLDGSYNGTFRDSYVGSGSNRMPWTECIDKSQIVMIGVRFTNSRRISKEHIDELRARYKVIDDTDDESE